MVAELANYPSSDANNAGVTSVFKFNNIDFDNPCLDPKAFTAGDAISKVTNSYDNTEIKTTIEPFTIKPPQCTV